MYPIDWADVVSVSAYGCLSIGQKSDGSVLITRTIDGTVIAFGFDDEHKISDTHKWKNVKQPRYY